jgi:hypothetical protein
LSCPQKLRRQAERLLLLLVVQVVLGPLVARSEAAAVFARSVQHLLG